MIDFLYSYEKSWLTICFYFILFLIFPDDFLKSRLEIWQFFLNFSWWILKKLLGKTKEFFDFVFVSFFLAVFLKTIGKNTRCYVKTAEKCAYS